ncbi:MAG: RnfABCDGE type electron transport complex subunit G [Lachnospiraceae bacterium]
MSKGGFMKDALILCVITLIAGALLGGVYEITKEPIALANQQAEGNAYILVLPEAKSFGDEDMTAILEQANGEIASLGYGNVLVDECAAGLDKSGSVVGYVVTATTKDGYGGAITASVGIDLQGNIQGIEFLTINETVGFGMVAKEDPEWKAQYYNKDIDVFVMTKNGAAAADEIDAISGATITSNAVNGAVNAAVYFANNCLTQ